MVGGGWLHEVLVVVVVMVAVVVVLGGGGWWWGSGSGLGLRPIFILIIFRLRISGAGLRWRRFSVRYVWKILPRGAAIEKKNIGAKFY